MHDTPLSATATAFSITTCSPRFDWPLVLEWFPLCLTISLARTKEMSSYLHQMMEDDGDDSEVLGRIRVKVETGSPLPSKDVRRRDKEKSSRCLKINYEMVSSCSLHYRCLSER